MSAWGIAATGNIAGKFVEGLTVVDAAAVVAVGSRSQASADRFGDEWDIPNRHASYEALAADPEVDIVYVSSPQHRHVDDTIMFLEAGKHVLCEKPFALSVGEAERMIVVAKEKGLFLMEAMWARFLPAYETLVEIVESGRIGEIRVIESSFGIDVGPVDPNHRLYDAHQAGGALLDLGIYNVHLCHLLLGAPDTIQAVGHIGETGVDERDAVAFGYASGAVCSFTTAINSLTDNMAHIWGSEGSIKLGPFFHAAQSIELTVGGETETIGAASDAFLGYQYQARHVEACLAAGLTESPRMSFADTLEMLATCDEARRQIGLVYPSEGF